MSPTTESLYQDSPAVQREVLSGDRATLAEIARDQPPSRSGRPVSPSCIWRWARQGLRVPGGGRARLEVCRIGGRWLTSRAALARFVRALNPQPGDTPVPVPPPPRTVARRAAEVEQAQAELRSLGI